MKLQLESNSAALTFHLGRPHLVVHQVVGDDVAQLHRVLLAMLEHLRGNHTTSLY